MKKKIKVFKIILLTTLMSPIFFSCKKDKVPETIISLNDELLYASYYDPSVASSLTYGLDIDEDCVPDLTFELSQSIGSTVGRLDYATISLSNEYEILTRQKTIPYWYVNIWTQINYLDTIYTNASRTMPLNFHSGDEVRVSDSTFSNELIYLSYLSKPGSSGSAPSSDKIFNHLVLEEDVVIVLKKTINNEDYLGWLKIRILNYTKIKLINYRRMTKCNSLIIE